MWSQARTIVKHFATAATKLQHDVHDGGSSRRVKCRHKANGGLLGVCYRKSPLIAPHVSTMSSNDSSNTTTVILGSGIIGLSTAYYLSGSGGTDPKSIHLVDESTELFRCASGLAGGFLSADCMFVSPRLRTSAFFVHQLIAITNIVSQSNQSAQGSLRL
jgi:hypothetical protein